jgi:hypothetical protein
MTPCLPVEPLAGRHEISRRHLASSLPRRGVMHDALFAGRTPPQGVMNDAPTIGRWRVRKSSIAFLRNLPRHMGVSVSPHVNQVAVLLCQLI